MIKKTDRNQAEIVKALREIGCSVQDLSGVGGGCPDLLVNSFNFPNSFNLSYGRDENILMEVKTAKGKLNNLQKKWHDNWPGKVYVVRTIDEALAVVRDL